MKKIDFSFRLSLGDLLNIGSAIIGSLIIVAASYYYSPSKHLDRISPVLETVEKAQTRLTSQLAQFNKATEEVAEAVAKFKAILEKIEQLPNDADMRLLVAKYRVDIDTANDRLQRIEALIIQSPDKAVSQLLLKRDFDELRRSIEERLALANVSIDRLDNLFRWAFGGVIFAILAQGISGFFGKSRSEKLSEKRAEETT